MKKVLTLLLITFVSTIIKGQNKIYPVMPLPADSIPLTEYFGKLKKWEFKTAAFNPQAFSKKTHHSFIMLPEKFEYKRRYIAALSQQPQSKKSYLLELAGAVTDALVEEYIWKRTFKSLYGQNSY